MRCVDVMHFMADVKHGTVLCNHLGYTQDSNLTNPKPNPNPNPNINRNSP